MVNRNPDIQYINPGAALPELPPLNGPRYTDTVPDTLDLAEVARLAIHGSTAMTDPDANYEQYWFAGFDSQGPMMLHSAHDWVQYKSFGPTSLLRTICGSTENHDVDWQRMLTLRQMQAPDGFLYEPVAGRPWSQDFSIGGYWLAGVLGDQYCFVSMAGRQIESALDYWKLTGDDSWRAMAEGICRRALELLVDHGEYGYMAGGGIYRPGASTFPHPPPSRLVNSTASWLGKGAMYCYRLTGYEPALVLARKLARYFVDHSGIVPPDGDMGLSHVTDDAKDRNRHFHTNTEIRCFLLNVALTTGEQEFVDLVRKNYGFGRDRYGNSPMGFFPESIGVTDSACEICEVADMIYLGLLQSTAGIADCWDDVDRWVRNMFVAGQITDTSWAAEYFEQVCRGRKSALEPALCKTHDRVLDRIRGAWGGWITPNELQGSWFDDKWRYAFLVMNCCTGNALAQLYRVWRDMAVFDAAAGVLRVNLLLNKAMPEADIHSDLPNRGRVAVRVKTAAVKQVAIRLPGWVAPEQATMTINNRPSCNADAVAGVPPSPGGRASPRAVSRIGVSDYLVVSTTAGQTVTVDFPVAERNETLAIMGRDWPVVLRGHTIVDIQPAGKWGRIHHRPESRTSEPKLALRERYVHPFAVEI